MDDKVKSQPVKFDKPLEVKHVTFHSGVQFANKVVHSVNKDKHGAQMWMHPSGMVEIHFMGVKKMIGSGMIHGADF